MQLAVAGLSLQDTRDTGDTRIPTNNATMVTAIMLIIIKR